MTLKLDEEDKKEPVMNVRIVEDAYYVPEHGQMTNSQHQLLLLKWIMGLCLVMTILNSTIAFWFWNGSVVQVQVPFVDENPFAPPQEAMPVRVVR